MEVFKGFLLIYFFNTVSGKITIDINTGSDVRNASVSYNGSHEHIINTLEIRQFLLDSQWFPDVVETHLGHKPINICLKSPTPGEDPYKKYGWEQVTTILTVKSAKVKNITTKPVIVLSHDFENSSNKTIKVNTGISETVVNTITTRWSKNQVSISPEIEYGLNILVAKLSGTTALTYTSSCGSIDKSESVTIGTTSAVETELAPGQAVTAILSAKRGHFEIEVVYKAALRGNVAVSYTYPNNGYHFWNADPIENVLESLGLTNERTESQIIKVGLYSEASLKVIDKVTGLPV